MWGEFVVGPRTDSLYGNGILVFNKERRVLIRPRGDGWAWGLPVPIFAAMSMREDVSQAFQKASKLRFLQTKTQIRYLVD